MTDSKEKVGALVTTALIASNALHEASEERSTAEPIAENPHAPAQEHTENDYQVKKLVGYEVGPDGPVPVVAIFASDEFRVSVTESSLKTSVEFGS